MVCLRNTSIKLSALTVLRGLTLSCAGPTRATLFSPLTQTVPTLTPPHPTPPPSFGRGQEPTRDYSCKNTGYAPFLTRLCTHGGDKAGVSGTFLSLLGQDLWFSYMLKQKITLGICRPSSSVCVGAHIQVECRHTQATGQVGLRGQSQGQCEAGRFGVVSSQASGSSISTSHCCGNSDSDTGYCWSTL